jgi:hypothetical protein
MYHLSFSVTATEAGISPEKVNPILKAFKRKLQDLVLDAPPLSARVNDLDNFLCEERFARILASYHIVFHIVDSEDQGSADRFNSGTDVALMALMKDASLEMDGVRIQVLDIVTPRDVKDERLWPKER